ncbi:hypothetical protein A9Q84_07060 [Halobacteriovorax marinus]|uniref:Uncharacterized protein n=1 Tax=Halobacteriovorax marinus TaxID=97084 RepID=A0A1Y5FAA1_9BACT|nr:hypothetical protein A9Q84_07060 [Halobacteriovorax marinus]
MAEMIDIKNNFKNNYFETYRHRGTRDKNFINNKYFINYSRFSIETRNATSLININEFSTE